MAELPKPNKVRRNYLDQFAAAQHVGTPIHVYRDPTKPGSGVSKPALDWLIEQKLVELGDDKPPVGRPVRVTDLGHRVLAATAEAFR